MKETPFFHAEDPDIVASILNSCILFCNVIIAGEEMAAALKYDEENMFAPMIVLIEKDAAAFSLVQTAENLGIPVIKNIMLAKNLAYYGKAGEPIPEASYRDVSLIFARLGSLKRRHSPGRVWKSRREISMKIRRPLTVELGSSIFALMGEDPDREALMAQPLDAIRKRLARLIGLGVPHFRICPGSRVGSDEYRILFKGLEAGRGRLERSWYLTENMRTAAKAASSVIVRHVDEIIQSRAHELLGRDEVEAILNAAEEKYPVLTGELRSLLPLGIIREILHSLVSEQVSIRPISVILETLADWGCLGPAPSEMIIDQIRQSLKRQICLNYTDDKLTLRVLTLEPKIEKGFADISPGSVAEGWEDLISCAVRGMEEKGYPPVILCSPRARFPLKEATRKRLPYLAVLSYMEIPSDIRIEPLGEIHL